MQWAVIPGQIDLFSQHLYVILAMTSVREEQFQIDTSRLLAITFFKQWFHRRCNGIEHFETKTKSSCCPPWPHFPLHICFGSSLLWLLWISSRVYTWSPYWSSLKRRLRIGRRYRCSAQAYKDLLISSLRQRVITFRLTFFVRDFLYACGSMSYVHKRISRVEAQREELGRN